LKEEKRQCKEKKNQLKDDCKAYKKKLSFMEDGEIKVLKEDYKPRIKTAKKEWQNIKYKTSETIRA